MMNADMRPGMMGGFGANIPGKGADNHGFDSGRTSGAMDGTYWGIKPMTKNQATEALTGDGVTEVNELFRKTKIEKRKFSTGIRQVINAFTGDKETIPTVYFKQYADRALTDVTNKEQENGKVWERVYNRSQKIANTDGVVAWMSPDEGSGEDRFYMATHDGKGEGYLYSVALKHGEENTLWNFLDKIDGRIHDRVRESIKDITIVRDRSRGDKELILQDVVSAYTASLSPLEARVLAPFTGQLIAEASISEDVREANTAFQEKYIRKEVQRILENNDFQKALGVYGQSLGAWARQLEEKEMKKELNFQQPMDSVRVSGQSVKQKQLGEIPISSGYNIDPLRKFHRRHRGHSGGRGFRRYRIWGELEQTGGISPIYRRRNLTAKEAAKQLDFVNKAKKSSDAYLFLKKGSLADALLKGEVVVKKTEKDNNQDNRIYKTTEKSQIQRKKARSKDTLVYSVKKDSEGQISVKPEVAVSGEKQIFVAKARKPIKIDLRMGGAKERLQKKSQNKTRVSELRSERERIISLARREKRTLKKQEKVHLIQKSKKEAKKLVRREVLARRKNEIKKKLALETRKQKRIEKKMRKEVRRLRKSLKLIDRISRLAAKDRFDKTTDRKLTRKKLLKLARVLWGKESGIYEKFKEGKVSRKMIKRLRREAIRRFRLIEKKAKGERKRKMKMVRRLGRERRTMRLEKKRVQRSEKKIKMRKNGLIYEARRIIKKRKLNIFKDERVRKTVGMRVEKEVIGTGCPIKREEKELGGMLHKNGHLNGYSKFKLGQPEGYLVGGRSFEYLYPLNTQTIMSTNGKKTMYRIKLPSFGIIYRYKEELSHY